MAKQPKTEPAGKAPRGAPSKADIAKLAAGAGINMEDKQEAALFFQDKAKFEKLLAAQKLANKAVMDFGKTIVKHFGDAGVPTIKLAIKLDKGDADTQKDIKNETELRIRMLRWMGLTVGAQPSLFGEDRRPADEIAREAGIRAGMEGKGMKDFGYDESNPHWQEASSGWHEGQERIFNIQPLKDDDNGPTLLKADRPKADDGSEQQDDAGGEDEDDDDRQDDDTGDHDDEDELPGEAASSEPIVH